MLSQRLKLFLVAFFSTLLVFSAGVVKAQHDGHNTQEAGAQHHGSEAEEEKGFDAAEVIFGHILDSHDYHITSYKDENGEEHHISIPLPVLIYSPQRGFTSFMSSRFEHGHASYQGYSLADGKIVPVRSDGTVDESVQVFDLSLTRNVVQMLLSLTILVWLMLSIAKAYKKGQGVTSAPKGKQSLLEPVITFVRDEVAKPNLAHKYEKYLPYLLTVFFFILINNIFGLIPGTANVTGNIAFTVVLGVISFIVILFSTNGHFWGHIFNPPGVPGFVKPILVLVEFLGVFIKPFALIIRLFANMVAGHIIIICLISLIFIFGGMNAAAGWGASPVALGFTVFIYFIEVLVAFLQAFIFTNLTAVFIGAAFEGEHHEEAAHH
jgi:F-type H+-transporting ATPase subunit a